MGVLSDNRSQIVNGGLISASFVSDLYDVLTGNTLESVSISGSVNITGSLIGNLTGTADTASYVVTAQTASYVTTAQTASYVLNAVSSSFATSASYVLNAVSSSFATSASFATTASYSLVNVISSSSLADSSSFATSASFATTAATASYLENDYIYTEVTASSAEILALNTTPVELLGSPGANSYYDWKIIMELTHNGADYSTAGLPRIQSGGDAIMVPMSAFTTRENCATMLSSDGTVNNSGTAPAGGIKLNQPITLDTATTITSGNGTMLVKIWYKIKTFGTEL